MILDGEATINELINEDTKCWNVSPVQEIFNEEEAMSLSMHFGIKSQPTTIPISTGWYVKWKIFDQ
jgi:hypothetical protein